MRGWTAGRRRARKVARGGEAALAWTRWSDPGRSSVSERRSERAGVRDVDVLFNYHVVHHSGSAGLGGGIPPSALAGIVTIIIEIVCMPAVLNSVAPLSVGCQCSSDTLLTGEHTSPVPGLHGRWESSITGIVPNPFAAVRSSVEVRGKVG